MKLNRLSLKSWVLLCACNGMWALQFTCVKLVQDQVGIWFTVWCPMVLATLLLIPLVRKERKPPCSVPSAPKPNFVLLYLLLALIGVVPGQVFMTLGTRMTLASNAALLTLTLPLATALFAVVFLSERMTPTRFVSFALALTGVLLCSGIDFRRLDFSRGQLLGNLLVFLAILGSAFYNSYGKKVLEWHSPMEMLFWTYVVVTIAIAPLVVIADGSSFRHVLHFTLSTWIGLLLLTLFHNYLSMVLFLKALKQIDAIQAALSNYLIAFFGIPIAAIWLGERLTWPVMMGGLLVLTSTLLITLLDHSGKPQPAGMH